MNRPEPGARALRLAPHALIASLGAGALGALAAPAPALTAAALAMALVSAAALILRSSPRAALVALTAGLLLTGWIWGSARIRATAPPRMALPAQVTGRIEVVTPPRAAAHGSRAEARAVALRDGRGAFVPAGARFVADFPDGAPPPLGACLDIRGRASAAAGPDAPAWWRAHLARRGIAARLRVRRATPAGRRGGAVGLRDRLRNAAVAAAGRGASGERAAVVRGLALGGGDGLSQATAQAFRDAGLWHLLAVSGQNIAIVAFAVLAALRGAGVGRRASVAAAGVVLVAYCLACDGGASVARAGIVGALGLTAELGSRARDRWHLLLAGLVALVLHQPRAVGDPGLQLSFAAVVGILAVAPPVAAVLRGWMPGRVAELAGQAAGATLATAPVVIWHFGTLSLAGLVVNVVAVPLAAPVVILALCGIGLAVVLPPAAVAAGWLAGVGAGALIGVARIAAAAPAATVPLPRWSVPLSALPAVAIPLVARRTWTVTPPRLRPPRWAAPAAGAMAAVVAVALAVPRPGAGAPWPAAAAVTALDIGQGDAILLRSPDGAAALIDTGPPGAPAAVVARLRDAGVRRLDALLLTHHQLDHDGAAASVLRAVTVGVVLTASASPAAEAEAEARARGIASRRVSAGDAVRVGSWSLEVLWPPQDPPRVDDPNDASMVILARSAGMDVLLTADAESGILRRLPLGRVDVLKVSHHGSADPGLGPLLDRLRPAAALISVGAGNRYGHPDRATLDALDAAGVRVARTDRVGSATVTVAGGGAALSAERTATGVSAP